MGNRTATSVEQMWEQAMANMQRGSRSANHMESTEERVEGSDTGAGKSGRGKSVREVGQAVEKESGVQGTENAERVGAPEKYAVGAEVVAAKKIPNTRSHGSPFAPREIPTAPGMSGTPINKEPFHPKPSVTSGVPWVGGNRDIDPFNNEDVKAFQERDRQAIGMLSEARPISASPSDWSGTKAVPISADTKDWKGSKAVPLARPENPKGE